MSTTNQLYKALYKAARLSVLLLLLGFALSACGGSGSSEPNASGVRAVMSQFANDLKQSKFGDACDLMTADAQARLGSGMACGPRMALAAGLVGAGRLAAAITSEAASGPVTVTGYQATLATANGRTATFVYAGDRWLIGPNQG